MLARVVAALAASGAIARIVVVGVEACPEADQAIRGSAGALHYLPNTGNLYDNAIQGLSALAADQDGQRHALLTSADVPLLTGESVGHFLQVCAPYDQDVYWGIVAREVMEAAFPESRRTYLGLVEGEFCNGELYLVRIAAALQRRELLRELVEMRKHVLRQALRLGPGVLLRLLLRRLRMQDAVGVAWRTLRLHGTPVILPFAESGMDVDKPHQLAQVEAYLQAKAAAARQDAHA